MTSSSQICFVIFTFLIAVVALILSILAYMSDDKDAPKFPFFSESKEKKGCCTGCQGCSKYTKQAIQHMEKEGRSVEMEMTGIVVDMRCYSQNLQNWTDRHITATGEYMDGCGQACAKMGIPVGLLEVTETGEPVVGGKVYVLLTPSIQVAKYMEKLMHVKGRFMKDSHAFFLLDAFVKDEKDSTKWKNIQERLLM